MKKGKFIFAVVLNLIAAQAHSTQDHILAPQAVSLSWPYRIEPQLLEALPCSEKKSCKHPVFAGDVELIASVSLPYRRLKEFTLKVGGQRIASDMVERYKDKAGFDPGDVVLLQSPGYLPDSLRKDIIGLGAPYITLRGPTFEDATCKSERRYIQIKFSFETNITEIEDSCVSD